MKEMLLRIGNMVAVACVVFFGIKAAVLAHPIRVHHDLAVTLYPQDQRLTGMDTLKLEAPSGDEVLLILADDARVIGVSIGEKAAAHTFKEGHLRIPIPDNLRQEETKVAVSYEAFFRDIAPRDPAYTEDPSYGVTGVISPEGTFLLAAADWYPDLPGSRPTFRVRVAAPAGYEAVTSGRRVSRSTKGDVTTSIWETIQPSRGLALSAGPYVVREKETQGIPIYTYFFPEDDHLSTEYLEATARYLNLYIDLLGPYPFEKFAVVENFFPTGYGFSSYTLLGRKVIRLPFILETSLGHEVSHVWWGNGVIVEHEQGNWSEGLTTYVADHLFKERSSAKEGREYRMKTLRSYATLVFPENDFPLQDFASRTSPSTHAVGYGKCLMVFHMARRLVGDEAFWTGLREVFQNKLFQRASWDDFALAFERAGKRNLRPFFHQWVAQRGAPKLALQDVGAQKDKHGWAITGRLTQQAPFYDLEVPFRIETEGQDIDAKIFLTGQEAHFALCSKKAPRRLVVDPDVDIFRRLDPGEIPPVINGIKGSTSLVALAAQSLSTETIEASGILLEGLGQKHASILPEGKTPPSLLETYDVLYLGVPEAKDYLPAFPKTLSVSQNRFTLDGVTYDAPGDCLFVVFFDPKDAGRVIGLFLPLSNKAAANTARKISHYGKYSYLIFRDGVNQIKGTWPVSASPLIHTFKFKETDS
jgi:aminopeptidase N